MSRGTLDLVRVGPGPACAGPRSTGREAKLWAVHRAAGACRLPLRLPPSINQWPWPPFCSITRTFLKHLVFWSCHVSCLGEGDSGQIRNELVRSSGWTSSFYRVLLRTGPGCSPGSLLVAKSFARRVFYVPGQVAAERAGGRGAAQVHMGAWSGVLEMGIGGS